MHGPRSFAATVLSLALLAMSTPVHGDVVLLTNLNQTPQGANSSPFVGQSFIAGAVDQPLFAAQMRLDLTSPPTTSVFLEVESRNFDGTVGSTLFNNFTSSFDSTTGVVTFTANSPFELTAGAGYWLVLSDRSAGVVAWDFESTNVYQSQFGYGLPSFNTAWSSNADNGLGNSTYYQPSDGPQLFQLIGATAVPEPSSFVLLCIAGAIAVFAKCFRAARASRFQRMRVRQPTDMLHR
jgi:hypothetical protein